MSAPTAPLPGPVATCPCCSTDLVPEWGNPKWERKPLWRLPDHPSRFVAAGYGCPGARLATTSHDYARAARRAELDAARAADPAWQAARVRYEATLVGEDAAVAA